MREQRCVDAHNVGDSLCERQKLGELLRRDRLVLGTGIRHNLRLVHVLVGLQHRFWLEPLVSRQDSGKRSQIEQLARCSALGNP